MSLIYWWPFTDNTVDKVNGKIFTSTNWSFQSSGKIGNCFTPSWTDSNTISRQIYAENVSIPETFSVAVWVKNINNFNSPRTYCPIQFSDGDCWLTGAVNKGWDFSHEYLRLIFNNGSNVSGNAGNAEVYWEYNPKEFLGNWYHIAFTVNKATRKAELFINGVSKGIKDLPSAVDTYGGTFKLKINWVQGWMLDGSLNDLRIYNHALSKKEVQELSKALVLHYTFDNSTIESTTNLLPLGQQTQSNTAATIEVTSGLVNGATYTLSTYVTRDPACTSTNPRLTLRFFYSDGTNTAVSKYHDGGTSYPKDGVERYYYITATADPSKTLVKVGGWLLDHSSGTGKKMTATRSQLEIKDHPTLYTPDTRPAILSNNTGIIIGNNIDTANTVYSPDAAIGNGALKCSNTSLRTPITGDITQGVTISCWVKGSIPTDSRVVFADYNSKLAFGFFSNGQAIITCAGYGHKYVTDIKTPWTDGWNHIVVRRDSAGTVQCFLNSSELALSGSQEWSHSATTFSIGSRNNGAWTSYFNGLVDDVRVYHTTLSDNDIKELYGSRWAANKTGQVFSNAINEAQPKFQITKGGINNCHTLSESGILPSNFIPLQYIQSSGTQFINTNHLATENTRTIFDYEYLNSTASWAGLFGSDNNPTNNDMGYGVFLNGSAYSCYVSNHTTGGCWNQPVGTWTQNKRTLLDFTHSRLAVDGLIYNLKTTTFTTSLVPIYLFSFRRSTGNAGISAIRLYNCQIWEGTALVRNFIPAKAIDGQVVGLYDTVNHKFYINAGSGAFTAGPPVVSQLRDGSLYCAEFNEI